MRFKQYLTEEKDEMNSVIQEEYFIRKGEFEIFKNPSNKEILSVYNHNNDKALRALVDFDNDVVFIFGSDLLHQEAGKVIGKDKSINGVFYCAEIFEGKQKMLSLILSGDTVVMKNGKLDFLDYSQPRPDMKHERWMENKFKILGSM